MSPRTRWRTQSRPGCSGWSTGRPTGRATCSAGARGARRRPPGGRAARPGPGPGPRSSVGSAPDSARRSSSQLTSTGVSPVRSTPSSSGTMSTSSSTDTARARRRSSSESGARMRRTLPRSSAAPLTRQGETRSRRVIVGTPRLTVSRPPPGDAACGGGTPPPDRHRRRRSAGLEIAQRRSDRQPQPMQESSPSRSAISPAICSSSRDAPGPGQPGPVGLGRGPPVGQRRERSRDLVQATGRCCGPPGRTPADAGRCAGSGAGPPTYGSTSISPTRS